jgi:hypothetical protein
MTAAAESTRVGRSVLTKQSSSTEKDQFSQTEPRYHSFIVGPAWVVRPIQKGKAAWQGLQNAAAGVKSFHETEAGAF